MKRPICRHPLLPLPLVVSGLLMFCALEIEAGTPIREGSPFARYAGFEFAVYYLPAPAADPVKALAIRLKKDFPELKFVDTPSPEPASPAVAARMETDVAKNYAPPDMRSLAYFGRGLSREQAEAVQNSRQALILFFAAPREKVRPMLRAANRLVGGLAHDTGGLVWDEETREMFTPQAWGEKRVSAWVEEFPAVTDHIVIHSYRKDTYVRAITLGMGKFGLPDVVVNDFSWSANRGIGNLMNAVCQSLVEGGAVRGSGEFDLALRSLKNRKMRRESVGALKPNAEAVARLVLVNGVAEEGDPRNRLAEIGFDRYPGVDLHARQDKMLSSLFGWEDAVVQIRHTRELETASRRARTKLPALRDAFNAGLAPGEFIQVKAPFRKPDEGSEWMWVEVVSWKGTRITGLLKNEPFHIPTLHGGQEVTVSQEDVFDFIHVHPDGRREGNETAAIIEKINRTGR